MTACVKSACLVTVVEKQRDWRSAFVPLRQNMAKDLYRHFVLCIFKIFRPKSPEINCENGNKKCFRTVSVTLNLGFKMISNFWRTKSDIFNTDDSPYRVAKLVWTFHNARLLAAVGYDT